MDARVRAEYEQTLRLVVLRNGQVTKGNDDRSSYYGWTDYHATEHIITCRPFSDGTPVESTWSQFQGTFYEGSDTEHGIDLPGVGCVCGRLTDRTVRLHASVQEIAEMVFTTMVTEAEMVFTTMVTELDQRVARLERGDE